MSVKPTNEGKCFVCNEHLTHMAATKHVGPCIEEAMVHEAHKDQTIYLMKIAGASQYWMYIEVQAKATLADIDDFLRQKWLECCGHLSMFDVRGTAYYSDPSEPNDLTMDHAIGGIFESGMRWTYEYDFENSTELTGTVLSVRQGHIDTLVRRVARNYMPHESCEDCDALAEAVCSVCDEFVCEDCADDHKCGEQALLSTCNSPRVGVCAYEGLNDDDFELEEHSLARADNDEDA